MALNACDSLIGNRRDRWPPSSGQIACASRLLAKREGGVRQQLLPRNRISVGGLVAVFISS